MSGKPVEAVIDIEAKEGGPTGRRGGDSGLGSMSHIIRPTGSGLKVLRTPSVLWFFVGEVAKGC
jgi:hypothetical protein